jgi:hypothetical protein
LISEASVPAARLLQSGRVYAEVDGPVNTGLALANPNDREALITFYFSDASGSFGAGSTRLSPGQQLASFLNQPPFNGNSSLHGTFTFSSSVPISALALRQLTNQRNEPLFTTLPVVDLSFPLQTSNLIFPHFADGAGWSTQIVLINPTDTILSGTVQFRARSGTDAALTLNGQPGSSFSYSLPPRSSERLRTGGTGTEVLGGSIRIVPASGSSAPAGVTIFSFGNAISTVSEAGVPAVPVANTFRMYVETSGDFDHGATGSIQTGIAVTNTSVNPAAITLELFKPDGSPAGIAGSFSLPPNGQKGLFLNQVDGFSSMPAPFQGVLRVSSSVPISIIGLRGRYNERTEFLMTTIPTVDESSAASTNPLFFSHFAHGSGYTTQFVLISGQAAQSSAGTLKLFSSTGAPLGIRLQ